ncbi:hypothetical protein [Corynebacterium lowii]|nr:hypothetical protein [Corynebacterium lowii]MDP9852421.1 hypothetical protein [Corynebacterium lowii]
MSEAREPGPTRIATHATDRTDRLGTFYTYRPTTIKRILSGVSLGVALLFLFAAFHGIRIYQGHDIMWNLIAGIVFTVSTGLPGAYWLAHTLHDARNIKRWALRHGAYGTDWQWLAENKAATEESHELPHLPPLPKRRWWAVWVAAAALFVVAAQLGHNMSVV